MFVYIPDRECQGKLVLENEWMLLNKNYIVLSRYKDVDKTLNQVCKFSEYPE